MLSKTTSPFSSSTAKLYFVASPLILRVSLSRVACPLFPITKTYLSELLTTMLYPFSENEYNLLPFLSYKVLEPLYMTNVPFWLAM